jgi:hypothetical protein
MIILENKMKTFYSDNNQHYQFLWLREISVCYDVENVEVVTSAFGHAPSEGY